MTRFEVIVNVNGVQRYLDTFDYEPISFNYNIADIQDLSNRNSAYSKTIKIPDTRNNRDVLGDIGDLSVVDSTFNPNKKTRCWILVDTVVVFKGYLQIKGILDNREIDEAGFEAVIYADNDNFFTLMGDDFLTDLDFSELNHTWSEQNIVTSWTQSWNWGYFYPLIDYGYNWDYADIRGEYSPVGGQPWVRTAQMFPATNVRYIWDKIFRNTGFSYQSNFLNSDVFQDLYLPYNRGPLIRDEDDLSGKFSVGFLNTSTFSQPTTIVLTGPINSQRLITLLRVRFNNENSPYGDPNNLYNTTTFFYTAPANFVNSRFVYDFDITFLQGTPNYTAQTSAGSGFFATSIAFRREFNPLTGVPIAGGVIIPINGSGVPTPFTTTAIPTLQFPAANRVVGQVSTAFLDQSTGSINRRLYPNERVWVEVRYSRNMTSSPFVIAANAGIMAFSTRNNFYSITSPFVAPGEIIPYNQCIPFNFKQKDFVLSIIRMFNLYVEPSKVDDNTLIIEPRDQFYAAGAVKDWTYKLDISDIQGQVLGETQNRRTFFRYRDDTDYFNTDYLTVQAGISYGEFDYLLDNDFVKGEKKIEISFSPTPIVQLPDSNLIVYPKIVKLNNNVFEATPHNVRILTKKRNRAAAPWNFNAYQFISVIDNIRLTDLTLTTPHNFQVGDVVSIRVANNNVVITSIFEIVAIVSAYTVEINLTGSELTSGAVTNGVATPLNGLLTTNSSRWSLEGKIYRAYPYLGHLNDPFEPDYDINFGQVTGYYYPEELTTNQNLYEVYWSNFIAEISDKDSRLITANFYLTALDIADFRFSDNIYINNQYYRVNKIADYDPGIEKTTKIELIKSKFISIPDIVSATSGGYERNPFNVGISSVDAVSGQNNVALSTNYDNVSIRGNSLVNGKNNYVGGSRVFVSGSSNTISTSDATVLGSFNTVETENTNTIVVGSNNSVGAGAGGSFIFGSNQAVNTPNTFVMNARFVVSADIIDASRNEILNLFPDNKVINFVSASRNAVREPWSADVSNIVSAGRIDETFS